jgi:hypothetical protein
MVHLLEGRFCIRKIYWCRTMPVYPLQKLKSCDIRRLISILFFIQHIIDANSGLSLCSGAFFGARVRTVYGFQPSSGPARSFCNSPTRTTRKLCHIIWAENCDIDHRPTDRTGTGTVGSTSLPDPDPTYCETRSLQNHQSS